MGDYQRSTREINLEMLESAVRASLAAHIEQYALGEVLNDVQFCIESFSEKKKKGLFSGPGPALLKTVVILTAHWLFEIQKAGDNPPVVRSARLVDLTASDYEKSPFYARIPDTGIEITGQFTGASENGTSFIGLGQEPAGMKLKDLVIQAVQAARK
jgi:hypothetical protein